jgi:hypothetical protein
MRRVSNQSSSKHDNHFFASFLLRSHKRFFPTNQKERFSFLASPRAVCAQHIRHHHQQQRNYATEMPPKSKHSQGERHIYICGGLGVVHIEDVLNPAVVVALASFSLVQKQLDKDLIEAHKWFVLHHDQKHRCSPL